MIRDILCNSDCIYQENGLCEKQNDVVMCFGHMKEYGGLFVTIKQYVKCSDYMPRKIKQEAEK